MGLNPTFPAASLKAASVLRRAERLQLEGVMQHSSGSRNFPEHSRGHSPLCLCLSWDKSTEYQSPETSMAPQTPFGFSILCFSPGGLGGVWDPEGEMDHILLMRFNLQHPDTKTLTSDSFVTESCSVALKYLQGWFYLSSIKVSSITV